MKKYRFIGTLADLGGARLEAFGQPVELDEATARHSRGPAVLPEEVFETLGFTDEELKRYRNPGPRAAAPEEFQTKLRAAFDARREYVTGGNE